MAPASDYEKLWANGELLLERFERIVQSSPDRSAIVTEEATISLAVLNGQANALARRILEIGPRSPFTVALFMDHGAAKVAAAIGVLKAGGAYVIVDTVHNDRGVSDLFDHCRAPVIVTDLTNADRCHRLMTAKVAMIDMSDVLITPVEANPNLTIAPDDWARVIYTSGSTGTPKAVIRSHGNERDIALATVIHTKFRAGYRVAFMQHFLSSHVLGPFIAGATLHPFDLRRQGLADLKTWLQRHEITNYEGILTGFRQLLEVLEPTDSFPAMHAVTLTGEPLHRTDIERFDQAFDRSCVLTNLYASTDHPKISCFTPDRSALPRNGDVVPLGFPIPGSDLVLLDDHGNAVPQGAIGEIVVRGTMLSPGYWDDPEKSAEVWTPNPAMPGGQFYRTGDLAVLDQDGCLHGRGRVDQQIKIRGHRVLPSEIENILTEHPAIRAAVVVLDQVNLGGDRLVGYIVSETNPAPTTSALRGFLGAQMPDHMVPSVFMPVSEFKMTASGKVDRRALPPPKIDLHARVGDIIAPANDVEVALKEIWEALLGEDAISVDDDFFLIGGDSVLALAMFMKVEESLGVRIPFESLWLQGSTIRSLAESITGEAAAPNWPRALPLQTNGAKPTLFVVSMASTPVYCLSLIRHLGADQPVYGLPAKGVAGDALPDRRIEDMAAHCITLMRQVQPYGPYRILGHSAAGLVAFEIVRILHVQGIDVSKLVLLDCDLSGTVGRLAGRVLRRPFKAARFAGSLTKQALGMNEAASPVTLSAAQRGAFFRYRMKPYSGSAILVTSKQRQQRVKLTADWRRWVKGGLTTAEAPGGHNSMLQEPYVGELAERLTNLL